MTTHQNDIGSQINTEEERPLKDLKTPEIGNPASDRHVNASPTPNQKVDKDTGPVDHFLDNPAAGAPQTEEKNQENQPSAQHLPPSFAHPGQMAQDLDPSPTPYGADEPSQNPSFNPPAPDLDDSFDFDL